MRAQKSADRVLSVICGFGAPLMLMSAILVAGSLHPNYSHLSQAVSALGAREAPYRAILNYGGLIPAGLLTFFFSVTMFRSVVSSVFFRVSAVLVALVGLGRLMAGIFPCDPGCLTFVSTSARIHAIAGFTALSTGVLAPLAFAVGLRSRRKTYLFYLSLGLGLCALVTLMAALSRQWPEFVGLFQRCLLIFTYAWIIVVAIGIGIKQDPVISGNGYSAQGH